MSIEMQFNGLDDLIDECRKYADEKELLKTDKKILQRCADKAHKDVTSKMKRSRDVSKSGRNGSRTFNHSADAVPMSKVKKKKDRLYVVIGWDKGDNSPYFYTKFIEWGTSQMSPFPVFLPATRTVHKELRSLGMEEYGKLLNFLER